MFDIGLINNKKETLATGVKARKHFGNNKLVVSLLCFCKEEDRELIYFDKEKCRFVNDEGKFYPASVKGVMKIITERHKTKMPFFYQGYLDSFVNSLVNIDRLIPSKDMFLISTMNRSDLKEATLSGIQYGKKL